MKKILGIIILVLCLTGISSAQSVGYLSPIVVNSQAMIGMNFPTYVVTLVLAASTADSVTPPAGAKYVLFSGTGNFYVGYNFLPSVAVADVKSGVSGELNPVLRSINGVSLIGVISASINTVTLSFYK